jgi:hypothetical protein
VLKKYLIHGDAPHVAKLLCEMNEMTIMTTTKKKKIQPADFSKKLFWDTEPFEVNLDKHAAWIVERVLDYGEWSDVKLLRDYYGMEKLREIAMGLRSLEPKSLAFIATVTHTPENQFRCYELVRSKEAFISLKKDTDWNEIIGYTSSCERGII